MRVGRGRFYNSGWLGRVSARQLGAEFGPCPSPLMPLSPGLVRAVDFATSSLRGGRAPGRESFRRSLHLMWSDIPVDARGCGRRFGGAQHDLRSVVRPAVTTAAIVASVGSTAWAEESQLIPEARPPFNPPNIATTPVNSAPSDTTSGLHSSRQRGMSASDRPARRPGLRATSPLVWASTARSTPPAAPTSHLMAVPDDIVDDRPPGNGPDPSYN